MIVKRNLYINTHIKGAIIYDNHMANYTLLSMVRQWGGTDRDIFKFEASQVYTVSSKPARATQHSETLLKRYS